ncbi:GNAT family N-acetyltransferase [Mucilaginibacter sp. SG564]|uniref:GNAT family N-acetyltransferase n=1 Tax=Mucilaginibacter sp. SG564 TaxID=2587022 RepID=UPI001554C670|nr:GNAT family N-acetyltransferase [Mucilaginibacter sp. SG564]NOW97544.1 N-acetylglutamate synthase-like GNAT family acetyltransferase [Mucilaginibacter sp. SG564]
MGIIYRDLHSAELHRIAEIDRAEEILERYYMQNGELQLRPDQQIVTHFDKDELEEIIRRQHKLIDTGGRVIGAFNQNTLVGVASVEGVKRGARNNYLKMDILYVSKNIRGQKAGQNLLEQCKIIAKNLGAEKLYISATPTKNTVDFYLKNDAVITKEINPELFALEPEDIHLELGVG